MKRLIVAAIALLWSGGAWAACGVSTVQVKDNAAVTSNWTAVNDGTNCAGETALVAGGAIVAAANALPVQPGTGATWAATQSGTWNINNISGTITLPTGASTAAKQPALGTAGTPSADVLTVQGVTSMTALKVDGTGGSFPISGTVTANQGGAPWTVTGTGTAGSAATGVLTVQGIASMTKLLVTPDANSAVNVAQINGVTPLMGNGVTGTGSPRATISSDNTAIGNWGQVATGAAPPASAIYMGANASGATGGHVAGLIQCDNHVFKHITSATDTNAVTGVTSQVIYICSWRSRAAGTATWFLESSNNTSGTCGSPTQLTGVATEAANTGETWGGAFWSGLKVAAANGLCINSTGTGGVDVDIWYTQF